MPIYAREGVVHAWLVDPMAGDGILSVVTPEPRIGRAVFGRSVGETVEVVVAGEPREWTITFVD